MDFKEDQSILEYNFKLQPTTGVFTECTTDNHSKETLRLASFDIDKKLYESRLLSFKSWPYSEKIEV